jgi:hypothetical protein
MPPDNESIFVYETPTGHVLHIQAPDQKTAETFANQWDEQNRTFAGNIKDIPGSTAYGFTKGLSTLGSSLGHFTAHEMGQPELSPQTQLGFNIPSPSPEETFSQVQKNITGLTTPPNTPFGHWAAKTGEMTAYNPLAALSPVSSTIATGVSAATSEAGRKAAEGTPLEKPAEILGGIFGPSILAGAVKAGGKLATQAQSVFSGAGPRNIEEAYTAGTSGKSSVEAQKFRQNISGQVPQEDVIPYARNAVANLERSQSENYVADMGKIEKKYGSTSLSFDPIDKALEHSQVFATRYGQPIDRATQPVRDKAAAIVNDWRVKASHDPRLATPFGMDGLKQKIWNEVVAPTVEDTAERAAAMTVFHGVKKAITDQAPEYKAVMQHYEDSANSLDNIKRTLSLFRGATDDTTLRKLQSVMNDNVNTNFGQRAKLVDLLEENGAPGLKASLAGQRLRPLAPTGAARMADPFILAGMAGHAAMGSPAAYGYLAAVPFMSPRLMGEVAHGAGRVSGYLGLPEMLQRSQSMEELKLLLARRANPLISQMLMRQQ